MHADLARHLGFAEPFLQQGRSTQASFFQSFEVSSNTGWVSHATDTTSNDGKCHYIM